MASIGQRRDGTWFIEFLLNDERRTVSVGHATKTVRESVKSWIERLVTAASLGISPDAETCTWLSKINDKLAARLAKVGLIESRSNGAPRGRESLGPFL